MASGIVGRFDVIGTVPIIVAKSIIKYTMPNLEMWGRINKSFTAGINVGDRVQIPLYYDTYTTPDLGAGGQYFVTGTNVTSARQMPTGNEAGFGGTGWASYTAGNLAEVNTPAGTPLLTYDDKTVSSVTVFISQWWYHATELSIYAEAVAQGNLQDLFKQTGIDTLAVRMDGTVQNLVSALSVNAAQGTLGTALTDDVILDGQAILDAGNVPSGDRSYVFSPQEKANYFKIDKYASSLTRGNTDVVSKGQLGNLYAMDWAVTTMVQNPASGQHRNIMFHRDAFAGTIRKQPATTVASGPDPSITNRIVTQAIWGVDISRDRFGVRMLGV